MSNFPFGSVVPMPTLPELSMVTKSPAVVLEIAKILPLLGLFRSKSAEGLVVPMPTLPVAVAKYAEPVEDIWVVEALPNCCKAVHVLALPKLSPIVLAAPPL